MDGREMVRNAAKSIQGIIRKALEEKVREV